MYFRKFLFLIMSPLLLTHCSLEIGEKSIDPSVFKITSKQGESSLCETSNYIEELKKYISLEDYKASNENIEKAIDCLSHQILTYKDSVRGESETYLSEAEILKLLKEPFINSGKMKSTISFVTEPGNSYQIFSIKNRLIDLMKFHQKARPINWKGICPIHLEKQGIVHKQEVDVVIQFLKDFYYFLASINKSSSYMLFMLNYTNAEKSSSLEYKNLPTLLKSLMDDGIWDTNAGFFKHINKDEQDDLIDSMIAMSDHYTDSTEELKSAHTKYMLMNMYLVELFFNLYDLNKNSILEHEELDNAFCLFQPIIHLLISASLNNRIVSFVIRTVFSERDIFDYILFYKKIPNSVLHLADFKFFERTNKKPQPDSQSEQSNREMQSDFETEMDLDEFVQFKKDKKFLEENNVNHADLYEVFQMLFEFIL